jgi:DHA1 family bicyclomycin/chloramphenicol resistance-like MFS transporter
LSDSLGRRLPLLIGVAGYALASLFCALAPSAALLVALRCLQGITGGAGIVIARAVVRDMYSGSAAARYFSRLILIMGLAPILAPVIGGQALRFTSWHGIFVILSVIALLLFAGAFLGLPETLPAGRRRAGGLAPTVQTFGRLARDRSFIGFALAGGLAFGAMFAYIAGSPFVLQGIYHVSPQTFSVIFALNALGFVITSQVNGTLVGRIEPSVLMRVGLLTSLTGALVLTLVILFAGRSLIPLLPPLFLLVAAIGFIVPNATALALSRHPEAAGTGSALLGVIQSGIGAIGAPLVGVAGISTALPMVAVIGTCSVCANLAILLKRGRD